jgi:hypothetical protein
MTTSAVASVIAAPKHPNSSAQNFSVSTARSIGTAKNILSPALSKRDLLARCSLDLSA